VPQIDVDPQKLRELAKALQASAQQLEQISKQARTSFGRAEWRDREGQKFGEQLNEALRALSRVSEQFTGPLQADLRRKIAPLEQYQR
jgi:uncharacterized protein YukE